MDDNQPTGSAPPPTPATPVAPKPQPDTRAVDPEAASPTAPVAYAPQLSEDAARIEADAATLAADAETDAQPLLAEARQYTAQEIAAFKDFIRQTGLAAWLKAEFDAHAIGMSAADRAIHNP